MWVDFRVWVLKQAVRTYINTYYQLTSRSPADFHFFWVRGLGSHICAWGYRRLQVTNGMGRCSINNICSLHACKDQAQTFVPPVRYTIAMVPCGDFHRSRSALRRARVRTRDGGDVWRFATRMKVYECLIRSIKNDQNNMIHITSQRISIEMTERLIFTATRVLYHGELCCRLFGLG